MGRTSPTTVAQFDGAMSGIIGSKRDNNGILG